MRKPQNVDPALIAPSSAPASEPLKPLLPQSVKNALNTLHQRKQKLKAYARLQRWKNENTGPGKTLRRSGRNTRSGRPKAIPDNLLDCMIRFVEKDYYHRAYSWEDLRLEFCSDIVGNWETVKEAFNLRGYFQCKACQQQYIREDNKPKRLEFAKSKLFDESGHELSEDEQKANWRTVFFTDEVHFQLNSQRTAFVIRRRSERTHRSCCQFKYKGEAAVLHAWAMVGYGYKGPLVFYGEDIVPDQEELEDKEAQDQEAHGGEDQEAAQQHIQQQRATSNWR
ncbi:hypothetical protein H2199_008747 [Coniosporium tulheliwenetii]|uniref:Uncharacterized protein n=1 Tax=Coniosporium tulheliwenetii TaxID=3383036 RepID=A0ACC2YI15_9PEZI|nr:hypothetical protein H2199_008747 [Cladosporium sp. JES 115]